MVGGVTLAPMSESTIDLDDRIWSSLKGADKVPYDASRPLKKLRDSTNPKEQENLFKELWQNLHRQGDVGIASYLAVPQLVTICLDKQSLDWNFIGLCVTIENCRLNEKNPPLPEEYQDQYFDSLLAFERYLLANFKNITSRDGVRLALALFATLNGQPELGRAIELFSGSE
jgi:hypothetical protein